MFSIQSEIKKPAEMPNGAASENTHAIAAPSTLDSGHHCFLQIRMDCRIISVNSGRCCISCEFRKRRDRFQMALVEKAAKMNPCELNAPKLPRDQENTELNEDKRTQADHSL